MKSIGFALAASLIAAPAVAANVFVRSATVSASEQDRRDDLTQIVRDSVKLSPGDYLVSSESRADAVLQSILMGSEGSYALRIDRLEDDEVVSSTERSVGDWRDIADIAHQATLSALETDERADDRNVAEVWPAFPPEARPSMNEPEGALSGGDVDPDAPYAARDSDASSSTTSGATMSGDASSSTEELAGESRGFRPVETSRRSPGYWTVGLGPGFGVGMESGNIMYSVAGGYVWELAQRISGKAVLEANLGSGSDNAQLIDLSAGADAYLTQDPVVGSARPYVTADVGFGTARNQRSETQAGVTAGAGTGLRFAATDATNMDVLLHYKLLTSTLAGANPSVLGIRAAFNF